MIQDDNNIPLLTEVIPLAPPQVLPPQTLAQPPAHQPMPDHGGPDFRQPDYASPAYPGAFHSAPAATSYQAPLPVPVLSFPPDDASQWPQEIRENVLQRLLAQADTVLQQQLRQQLALALDDVTDILAQRIKENLRQALTETVTQAVAEEMARFTSSRM